MAAVILRWNYMDNNSDVLDKFRLTDVLYGYQDENLEFIKEQSVVWTCKKKDLKIKL